VFQSANKKETDVDESFDMKANDEVDIELPELCCSKISRVYSFEGKLKQGCTSFFTLRRL
jgi:hypothetical protein